MNTRRRLVNSLTLATPLGLALARGGGAAVHAEQWARWPLVFLPAYGLASLWSLMRTGDAATGNGFEVAAGLEDGGYGPA